MRDQAKDILESMGLTLSEAFNLMLYQVKIVRGLPFEIRRRSPVELNDGFGSYICEHGRAHDYSALDFEATEREINDPNAKKYNSFKEMLADLEEADDV